MSNVVQKKQQQGGGWCGLINSKKVPDPGPLVFLCGAFSLHICGDYSNFLPGCLWLGDSKLTVNANVCLCELVIFPGCTLSFIL